MSVQLTGAMAVVMAEIPEIISPATQTQALATLGILIGIIMFLLGIFKLGSTVRFISKSVLLGFISAVAVNIIIGQLPGITGYTSDAGNRLFKLFDTLFSVASFDLHTTLASLVALTIALTLDRTRLKSLSIILAVVGVSAAIAIFNIDQVPTIADLFHIPDSLPRPVMPDPSLMGPLLMPALSLAFIALIQGAAVSKSTLNPDGTHPNMSRDFIGQGISNVVSAFFRGVPVGGSVSATAILITGNAKSRLPHFIAALVMIIVIVFLSPVAGMIAMPTLAVLLLLTGARTIKPADIMRIFKTGRMQAITMIITFVLTVMIPMQYAILSGVALSILMFIAQQSNHFRLLRWDFSRDFPQEIPTPEELPSNEIIVLNTYGTAFFAAASRFSEQLPKIRAHSKNSVVILRLRSTPELGSTFIAAINHYAEDLHKAGCALLLCGVSEKAYQQLTVNKAVELLGKENVFIASEHVLDSLNAARKRAETLLQELQTSEDT